MAADQPPASALAKGFAGAACAQPPAQQYCDGCCGAGAAWPEQPPLHCENELHCTSPAGRVSCRVGAFPSAQHLGFTLSQGMGMSPKMTEQLYVHDQASVVDVPKAANNDSMQAGQALVRTCIRFCTNACTSCLMVEEAMAGAAGWGAE